MRGVILSGERFRLSFAPEMYDEATRSGSLFTGGQMREF